MEAVPVVKFIPLAPELVGATPREEPPGTATSDIRN
jgi:hypothetical protein